MRKPLRSHKPVEAAHSFAWRSGPASVVPVVRPLVDGEGAVDLVRDRGRTGPNSRGRCDWIRDQLWPFLRIDLPASGCSPA